MKEAKLLCKVRTGFRITDVSPELLLHFDAEQYVSESVVHRSKQLQQAARAGAVELTWVERFQMKKPDNIQNVPPWLRNRGKAHVVQKQETAKPVEATAVPRETIQEMVAQAAESLDKITKTRLESMQDLIQKAVEEALAKQAEQTARMLREMAFTNTASVSAVQPTVQSNLDFTPEEKFIPSSLSLSGVGKVNVNVAAEENSVNSVDEALEVLKKKRGKKHE